MTLHRPYVVFCALAVAVLAVDQHKQGLMEPSSDSIDSFSDPRFMSTADHPFEVRVVNDFKTEGEQFYVGSGAGAPLVTAANPFKMGCKIYIDHVLRILAGTTIMGASVEGRKAAAFKYLEQEIVNAPACEGQLEKQSFVDCITNRAVCVDQPALAVMVGKDNWRKLRSMVHKRVYPDVQLTDDVKDILGEVEQKHWQQISSELKSVMSWTTPPNCAEVSVSSWSDWQRLSARQRVACSDKIPAKFKQPRRAVSEKCSALIDSMIALGNKHRLRREWQKALDEMQQKTGELLENSCSVCLFLHGMGESPFSRKTGDDGYKGCNKGNNGGCDGTYWARKLYYWGDTMMPDYLKGTCIPVMLHTNSESYGWDNKVIIQKYCRTIKAFQPNVMFTHSMGNMVVAAGVLTGEDGCTQVLSRDDTVTEAGVSWYGVQGPVLGASSADAAVGDCYNVKVDKAGNVQKVFFSLEAEAWALQCKDSHVPPEAVGSVAHWYKTQRLFRQVGGRRLPVTFEELAQVEDGMQRGRLCGISNRAIEGQKQLFFPQFSTGDGVRFAADTLAKGLFFGLVRIPAEFWMNGDDVQNGYSKTPYHGNDGLVDWTSCRAGVRDEEFKMEPNSPYYMAAVNHAYGTGQGYIEGFNPTQQPFHWYSNMARREIASADTQSLTGAWSAKTIDSSWDEDIIEWTVAAPPQGTAAVPQGRVRIEMHARVSAEKKLEFYRKGDTLPFCVLHTKDNKRDAKCEVSFDDYFTSNMCFRVDIWKAKEFYILKKMKSYEYCNSSSNPSGHFPNVDGKLLSIQYVRD